MFGYVLHEFLDTTIRSDAPSLLSVAISGDRSHVLYRAEIDELATLHDFHCFFVVGREAVKFEHSALAFKDKCHLRDSLGRFERLSSCGMFFEWLGTAWDSLLLDKANGQVFLTL